LDIGHAKTTQIFREGTNLSVRELIVRFLEVWDVQIGIRSRTDTAARQEKVKPTGQLLGKRKLSKIQQASAQLELNNPAS